MDQKSIEKIIRLFEQSSVNDLELEVDDFKIKLSKGHSDYPMVQASPAQIPPQVITETPVVTLDHCWVKAPLVGTYYHSSNPEAKPYVQIGQKVQEGDVVCLIEAMKVMNEIKAHKSGIITEINVTSGKMVEFNQRIVCIGDA